MLNMLKPLLFASNLWLKQKPTGQLYMTGRLGAARIVVMPLENPGPGEPEYGLFFGARLLAKKGGAQ